jgi:hypothetical protein
MTGQCNDVLPVFAEAGWTMKWLLSDPRDWPPLAFSDSTRDMLLRGDGRFWEAIVITWYPLGESEDAGN